ncbi:DUF1931 family protein [Actinoallomurus sp. NPDC052274]|uniref:DUF1931 family protein n=1 Tax=Actinoallomurus sp. NPDC052274 TaxID=3155420 RepID=UPI00343851F2
MPPTGIPQFQRLFRAAASLDVDKDDLKRYDDFVDGKTHDLLLIGQAHARANARDVIQPHDLPVTKGLQECVHEFRRLDEGIDVESLLERLAKRPPLDLAVAEETEGRLPELAGGLTVALARAFKLIDTRLKNPRTEHWERVTRVFDLLL